MYFLSSSRVRSNMSSAVSHFLGYEPAPSELKTAFIQSMNKAQSSPIRTLENDIYLEFDNPNLIELLVRRDVFSEADIENDRHILTLSQQTEVRSKFQSALDVIGNLNDDLLNLITGSIGSVACYHIDGRDGGTVSCCIGQIWLSPGRYWQPEYYAELIVHEFVHNSVFLDDMVNGIMPNIHLLDREEALVSSVIRKTRRGYDKSFHSACVGAALMYFHHLSGNEQEAESYVPSMRKTLTELTERDNEFKRRGENILSENGRKILSEMKQFVESRDYFSVTAALNMQHEDAQIFA